MYNALRIDADPTTWEFSDVVEQVPTSDAPVVLPVSHPLAGNLVLSPRSVGSAVFLEEFVAHSTRPNGVLLPELVLYVPSPNGPDVHSNPANFYALPDTMTLETLQAAIIGAMNVGSFLTVPLTQGVAVINGAALPFAVICPPST